MDTDTDDAGEAFTFIDFSCPRCGQVQSDEYELLSSDEIYLLTCEGCRRRFSLIVHECAWCGDETSHAWTADRVEERLHQLVCGTCGRAWSTNEDEPRVTG